MGKVGMLLAMFANYDTLLLRNGNIQRISNAHPECEFD